MARTMDRHEFAAKVAELSKALALMPPSADARICPVCLTMKADRQRVCYCDYNSGDLP